MKIYQQDKVWISEVFRNIAKNCRRKCFIADDQNSSTPAMNSLDCSTSQKTAGENPDKRIIALLKEWYGSPCWLHHRYFVL